MPTYEARDNFAVIRRKRVKRLVRGFEMPESSPESTDFIVESVGKKVEHLNKGDEVMIIGKKGEEYVDIPGETDYLIIDARFIPYIIHRDEE